MKIINVKVNVMIYVHAAHTSWVSGYRAQQPVAVLCNRCWVVAMIAATRAPSVFTSIAALYRLTHRLFGRLTDMGHAVNGFTASGDGCGTCRGREIGRPLYHYWLTGRLDGCRGRSHRWIVVGHLITYCAPFPVHLHCVVIVVIADKTPTEHCEQHQYTYKLGFCVTEQSSEKCWN